jgi:hypothetical protein
MTTTSKNAFVLIHFGDNIKYLELELYFLKNLRKHTTYDIIYMYSINDTPKSFVEIIQNYVTQTIEYNDENITTSLNYTSHYSSFNTLRTCNFIFAYNLIQYDKICIIESDMVIMQNIDCIFDLNTPSILYYNSNESQYNIHNEISINVDNLLNNCKEKSDVNGGILLFKPDVNMFQNYIAAINLVVQRESKYPNETLFQIVNPTFYNLPVKFNLSHYHTLRLNKYKINKHQDVFIFHFNETEFKHLDIIKDNWIKNMETNDKYKIKKIPVIYFNDNIYKPNKEDINCKLSTII